MDKKKLSEEIIKKCSKALRLDEKKKNYEEAFHIYLECIQLSGQILKTINTNDPQIEEKDIPQLFFVTKECLERSQKIYSNNFKEFDKKQSEIMQKMVIKEKEKVNTLKTNERRKNIKLNKEEKYYNEQLEKIQKDIELYKEKLQIYYDNNDNQNEDDKEVFSLINKVYKTQKRI
jgi:phosphotransferase system IIA component